jgi:hypothetical protein
VEGQPTNNTLETDTRLYKNELYNDFVNEYPDYGPKSKMTISRTKFYKWLAAYGLFKYGVVPEEGRDMMGRWIIIHSND